MPQKNISPSDLAEATGLHAVAAPCISQRTAARLALIVAEASPPAARDSMTFEELARRVAELWAAFVLEAELLTVGRIMRAAKVMFSAGDLTELRHDEMVEAAFARSFARAGWCASLLGFDGFSAYRRWLNDRLTAAWDRTVERQARDGDHALEVLDEMWLNRQRSERRSAEAGERTTTNARQWTRGIAPIVAIIRADSSLLKATARWIARRNRLQTEDVIRELETQLFGETGPVLGYVPANTQGRPRTTNKPPLGKSGRPGGVVSYGNTAPRERIRPKRKAKWSEQPVEELADPDRREARDDAEVLRASIALLEDPVDRAILFSRSLGLTYSGIARELLKHNLWFRISRDKRGRRRKRAKPANSVRLRCRKATRCLKAILARSR